MCVHMYIQISRNFCCIAIYIYIYIAKIKFCHFETIFLGALNAPRYSAHVYFVLFCRWVLVGILPGVLLSSGQ